MRTFLSFFSPLFTTGVCLAVASNAVFQWIDRGDLLLPVLLALLFCSIHQTLMMHEKWENYK